MDRGNEREREVLERFRARCEAGAYAIDPDSIVHADAVPREWIPLVDRSCPQLASSPDAWGRDIYDGSLVVLEVKCSYEAYMRRYRGPPPHYDAQLQARMACEGGRVAMLIEGEWFANDRHEDGDVIGYDRAYDAITVAEIRAAARQQWEMVEELRRRMGT